MKEKGRGAGDQKILERFTYSGLCSQVKIYRFFPHGTIFLIDC